MPPPSCLLPAGPACHSLPDGRRRARALGKMLKLPGRRGRIGLQPGHSYSFGDWKMLKMLKLNSPPPAWRRAPRPWPA